MLFYRLYNTGTCLDNGGMLLDFGILKQSLRQICNRLDHTNLNELTSEDGTFVFNQNPSAEQIARWIFEQLEQMLHTAGVLKNGTDLCAVDVFETPGSRARYRPGT